MTSQDSSAAPLWHGRFSGGPDKLLWDYTLSLDYDRRLAPFDLFGCDAHVLGLGRAGLLSAEEVNAIRGALRTVGTEMEQGTFVFVETDEDIHTAIERRVTDLAGDAGAKLHTGRSRNDQVATAFRLYCKAAVGEVANGLVALQETLLRRAEGAGDTYLPGYTHLQQAQPVQLSHHLLAHFWAFRRDVLRLVDAAQRMDVSPLGAGALAGSSLPLDPEFTAQQMGFSATFDNSLDAVSDRDFVAELLFVLALIGVHLSRIGEELVVWTTEEFGFARLDDTYSTGSSMLPQKKNPDIAELTRGKSGRLIGHLAGFLATLKSLPLSYNRDLQEDKEPLFDALDQITRGLAAVNGMVATVTFNTERMQRSADSPYGAATDLAELLVAKGVPFRQAHAIVGSMVRDALAGVAPLQDLVAAHPQLGDEAVALLAPGVSVQRRTTRGGGGPAAVAEQITRAQTALAEARTCGEDLQFHVDRT